MRVFEAARTQMPHSMACLGKQWNGRWAKIGQHLAPLTQLMRPYIIVQNEDFLFSAMWGEGNVISGLLATHLLASEFNRTVCVDYPSFQKAFLYKKSITGKTLSSCSNYQSSTRTEYFETQQHDTSGFTSECALKERLQVHEESVLYYTGNTYPRWPNRNHFDPALFHHVYHPTSDLLQYLP